MLKYGTVKLFCKKDKCRVQCFKSYQKSLSSKVGYLTKYKGTERVSNLDCDMTTKDEKCISSFIYVNDVPMHIEICHDEYDHCEIIARS